MEISLAGLLSGLYHNFHQLTVSIRHASTLKKMFYYQCFIMKILTIFRKTLKIMQKYKIFNMHRKNT